MKELILRLSRHLASGIRLPGCTHFAEYTTSHSERSKKMKNYEDIERGWNFLAFMKEEIIAPSS